MHKMRFEFGKESCTVSESAAVAHAIIIPIWFWKHKLEEEKKSQIVESKNVLFYQSPCVIGTFFEKISIQSTNLTSPPL